ncbi:MAG: NUDIX hydrolase [Alphaproteobacteria bacterium]|jgi:8-oxo-dGTP diphosphatase
MTQQETSEETSSRVWPRPAVSVAVFRDGKVLLAQRAKPPLAGVWSLPGGRVEPGEMARTAALRELKEETGITAKLNGITDVVDVILRREDGSLRAHYVIASFYGTWTGGEPRPESDCLGAEWVGLDELSGRNITEGTTEIIQQAARLLTSAQTDGA